MTRTELPVLEKISGIDVSEECIRNTHPERVNIFGIVSKCLFPQGIDKIFDMTPEDLQNIHIYL